MHDGYNRGRDRSRERSFSGNYNAVIELEVQATVGQVQDLEEPVLIVIE